MEQCCFLGSIINLFQLERKKTKHNEIVAQFSLSIRNGEVSYAQQQHDIY